MEDNRKLYDEMMDYRRNVGNYKATLKSSRSKVALAIIVVVAACTYGLISLVFQHHYLPPSDGMMIYIPTLLP